MTSLLQPLPHLRGRAFKQAKTVDTCTSANIRLIFDGLEQVRSAVRVGEVCAADVVDLSQDRWHHTLTILGRGDKPAVVPLPPRTVDAVHSAVGDRQAGPATARTPGSSG